MPRVQWPLERLEIRKAKKRYRAPAPTPTPTSLAIQTCFHVKLYSPKWKLLLGENSESSSRLKSYAKRREESLIQLIYSQKWAELFSHYFQDYSYSVYHDA